MVVWPRMEAVLMMRLMVVVAAMAGLVMGAGGGDRLPWHGGNAVPVVGLMANPGDDGAGPLDDIGPILMCKVHPEKCKRDVLRYKG